jgi:predicted HicB family RNase H-like nuclease
MAKSVIIGVRVPEPVKSAWEAKAEREGRSLSNWIKRQIELSVPSSTLPQKTRKGLLR